MPVTRLEWDSYFYGPGSRLLCWLLPNTCSLSLQGVPLVLCVHFLYLSVFCYSFLWDTSLHIRLLILLDSVGKINMELH